MIKHKIRTKDEGIKEVSLTPIKAIRNHCLECTGWSAHEVGRCTGKLCNLYPYRLGKAPEHKGKGNTNNFNEK